ncbi:MAG TPA: efflux RND transporter periplasmic adaptor subunit [Gemmatimonadaceae bacterium]|nr:efflux RND transporter periplasmic adaptor subunit [Gemmatimonadaceae bacterium]
MTSTKGFPVRITPGTAAHLIPLALLGVSLAGCQKKEAQAAEVQTVPITRQNIVVDVEATGVIAPINAVEVRSKASGLITDMRVETGSHVKPGDLLVQIDPRDAQNRYDQSVAALKAAQANLEVTKAQDERSEALAKQGVITAPELESARIARANAESQVASARTNLELARVALEDVTIRAPITGTVIAKNVSKGQVISSAINSPSGGTILLTMANLGSVVDSTLVNESDIGNVHPGQTATVHVDAYPNRTFTGVVEKIEPQATIQQSVTMFPVIVRLANEDGALMPGMNSDVSILVERRDDVLAIPNDAVRSPRDMMTAALALHLDPDSVRSKLQAQRGGRNGRGPGARPGAAGDPPAGGASGSASQGRTAQAAATPEQCDSVRAIMAKHPEVQARLAAIRQQMQSGSADFAQIRQQMQAVYDSAGIDAATARACLRRGQSQGGAAPGGAGPTFAEGGEETTAFGNTRPHPGLVFVKQNETFEPRIVMLGVGNYDVTQVLSGLKEGDQVALISAAMLQQARQEFQQRIQSRVGLPGVQQDRSRNNTQRQGAQRGGGAGR